MFDNLNRLLKSSTQIREETDTELIFSDTEKGRSKKRCRLLMTSQNTNELQMRN